MNMEIKISLDRRTVQHVCEGVPRELKKVVAGGSACPEGPRGGLTPSRGGDPKQVEDVGRLLGAGGGPAAKGLEVEAPARNFSMAAASSSISCCAVLSSMLPPPLAAALPKALKY